MPNFVNMYCKDASTSGDEETNYCFIQGVVTCASLIETFVNKIKMESSDQGSLGDDQGIRMKSEQRESSDQELYNKQ